MPKAKIKAPLDSITGTVEGNDRTIGRDKGLSSSLRKINQGTAGDKNNQPKTQLYVTKAPTRGGSKNRHSRAEQYCFCDQGWKTLTPAKFPYVLPWWRAVRDLPNAPITSYHIWMKICLKYMAEFDAFKHFGYCARYWIKNTSASDWVNYPVTLCGINTHQADGQDLEVYLLLSTTTKKGSITYDAKMIDHRLEHTVFTKGEAMIIIPALQRQSSILVDVYSFYDPVI